LRNRDNRHLHATCNKLTVFILSSVLVSSVHAAQLNIGTSFWPPYVDPKLPGQGLAISIVTAAFERTGYKPVVTIGPWDETLQETMLGHSAVIAATWKTAAREKNLIFSEPYLVNEIKFLKRRETKPSFTTLSDLAGLRIGVVYLYAYDEAFDADTSFVKVSETHIVPNLLQLLEGNLDLTVGDERTLRYEISRHLQDRKKELQFLPTPLATRDLYVAVSRHDPQAEAIIRDFNRGLEEIRQNGTYRKLLRQANEEIWRKSYLPH
jgi:polar amino acid transport system substrate-binding protein